MRTANPVFNNGTYTQASGIGSMLGSVAARPATMTVQGTADTVSVGVSIGL